MIKVYIPNFQVLFLNFLELVECMLSNLFLYKLLILKVWHSGYYSSLISISLEDTARYAGLLLAPAEGFGRGRSFFGQEASWGRPQLRPLHSPRRWANSEPKATLEYPKSTSCPWGRQETGAEEDRRRRSRRLQEGGAKEERRRQARSRRNRRYE